MRIVKEVPHPRFKITIFSWNSKYIVKIEDEHLEQVYKIAENELYGLDEMEAVLSTPFLLTCLKRFEQMSIDFNHAWRQRNVANTTDNN